jgi:shikimate dehydrogenase
MHNAAIAAIGEDYAYVAFHVLPENVGQAVNGMRALGIRGLNVTIPHKQTVMEYLDRISEEALAVGAVNTISLEDGDLVGYNTDVYGLSTALERVAGLQQFPECCVVLGAGGAARAAVYALGTRQEVRTVTVLNRTLARAESLVRDMEKITGKPMTAAVLEEETPLAHFADAGLVVNATSLGMYPHIEGSPLSSEKALHSGTVLYDTVFNPLQTRLMSQFQSVGASAYGGLDMLVYQGARSFQIWTGIEPSSDVMKQAIVGRFQS